MQHICNNSNDYYSNKSNERHLFHLEEEEKTLKLVISHTVGGVMFLCGGFRKMGMRRVQSSWRRASLLGAQMMLGQEQASKQGADKLDNCRTCQNLLHANAMANLQDTHGVTFSLPPYLITEPRTYDSTPALRHTVGELLEYDLTKSSSIK